MTTARQFLDFIHAYEREKDTDPEQTLQALPEDQFRLVLQASALLLTQLKREAQRRGIWDEMVQAGLGLKKSDLT
jgi:hypothetical protein